jgi:glycosyltransferase involved in cell wall biosynthesis
VIGGGPESNRLRALAGELGLEARVDFRGPQPLEDVERARAEVDVQVVPSIVGPGGRTEGLPTVIVEALGRCLPVIASSVTGVPELVIEGETGWLVPPGDAEALSEALQEVAADRPRARALAERGRERVLAEFDLARNVTEQLELFSRYSSAEEPIRP